MEKLVYDDHHGYFKNNILTLQEPQAAIHSLLVALIEFG